MENDDLQPSRWSTEETETLISIWGDVGVQQKFDGTVRDSEVYRRIKMMLMERGIVRFTLQQIRTKIKNLKKKFRQDKDFIRKSGNSYKVSNNYNQIDEILGDKIACLPSAFLETSLAMNPEGNVQDETERTTEVDDPLVANQHSENEASSSVFRIITEESQSHLPKSAHPNTPRHDVPGPSNANTPRVEGPPKKRKRISLKEVISNTISSTMKEFLEFEREAEKKQSEFNTQMLKLEEEKINILKKLLEKD